MVVLELLQLRYRVRRNGKNFVAGLAKVSQIVVEVAGFLGATRGRSGRVEVENYFFTAIVRKVDRLYKEFKSKARYYAGFSAVDYLPLPAKKLDRKQTYIDKNGNIGDASELTMIDTSDWTDMMWAVVRWHGHSRHERVMHLLNKEHEFVPSKHFDYTTKSWIEVDKCTKCYLPKTELNI